MSDPHRNNPPGRRPPRRPGPRLPPSRRCTAGCTRAGSRSAICRRPRTAASAGRCSPRTTCSPRRSSTRRGSRCCSSATPPATTCSATRPPCPSRSTSCCRSPAPWWASSKRAMVVGDLPFGSYQASPQQALASALRLVKEGGAHAVKLEGGRRVVPQVELLTLCRHGRHGPHRADSAERARHRRLPGAGPRRRRRGAAGRRAGAAAGRCVRHRAGAGAGRARRAGLAGADHPDDRDRRGRRAATRRSWCGPTWRG